MKADQFGTYTEQVMYRIGYMTANQRRASDMKLGACGNCQHFGTLPGFQRVRCIKNDLATAINATCRDWVEK